MYDGTGHMTEEDARRHASEQVASGIERGNIREHLNQCVECRRLVIDARDELRLVKK